jgi:hypothetical protein
MVENLRKRAQSCINTYTPPSAYTRVNSYDLRDVCDYALLLMRYVEDLDGE